MNLDNKINAINHKITNIEIILNPEFILHEFNNFSAARHNINFA